MPQYQPQYQQSLLGMTPMETSLAQVPMALAITGGGLLAPRIAGATGVRSALTGALALLVAGLAWLAPADPETGFLGLLGPFLLIGAGLGTAFVHVTSLAVGGAAAGEAGLVSGLVNTTRQMGGALGLDALVAVATGPAATGHVPDLTAAFLGAAVLATVALLLSMSPALRGDSPAQRGQDG